ncbi:MAG: DAK2 domain-containing protein, partial [Candidatus Thermochlorobacter sp.]
MPIDYLNGRRLKHAIIAGAESVIMRKEYLNKINVFPVADGDTGTNMALTLKSVVEGLYECDDSTVDAVVICAADAALVGSRGNSGSILAQFYQGMAEGLSGKERITAPEFGQSLLIAKNYAYEAMLEPKEGTILTVIRDWTMSITQIVQRTGDFKEIIAESIQAAKASLARTPDELVVNGVQVLKKAGVVDSGAQGFVDMLQGIHDFMQKGNIREYLKRKFFSFTSSEGGAAAVESNAEAITFQYCTEFVLENGENYDKKALRKALIEYGDSLIIGGSTTKTKVHIHTNEPETIFEIAARFGIVQKKKYEDMKAQHEAAFGKKPIGIVTDSTCDLPEEYLEQHDIRIVPLQVRFGEDEYLDRVTISAQEFYKRLSTSDSLPKTSQPATAAFKQVYEDMLRTYDGIVGVFISSGISGTLQNARTTSKFFKDRKFAIIDSKITSLGMGFLIKEAVKMRDAGKSLSEIETRLNDMVKNIRAYLSLETIDNLVRGGRLSKSKGFLAKLLHINPVLTFDDKGKVVQLDKGVGSKGSLDKAIDHATRYLHGKQN